MTAKKYLPGVDLVRFAAATMVMLFHNGWMAHYVPESQAAAIVGSLKSPPMADFSSGWVGVEIFFVISGLVIANSAKGTSPIDFAKSRVYRLYPAAWICATTSLLIYAAIGMPAWHRYINSLLLLPTGNWMSPVYWTLSVELMFYASVFLWKITLPRQPLRRLAAVLLVWSGMYLCFCALGWNDLHASRSTSILLRHGVFFALGILLADTENRHWVNAFLASIAVALCALEIATRPGIPTTGQFLSMPMLLWCVFTIGIAASARCTDQFALPKSCWPHVRLLGLMTYPVYLTHYELGNLGQRLLMRAGLPTDWSLLISAAIVLCAAFLIVRVAEARVRALLRGMIDWVEVRSIYGRPRWQFLYRPEAIENPPG